MSQTKKFRPYNPLHVATHILGSSVHRLEYDPVTQFKFHFFWTWFWFVVLVAIPFFPVLYAHSLSALIIQEVSMWANFVSHFTALGSAIAGIFAAGRQNEIPGLQLIKSEPGHLMAEQREIPQQSEQMDEFCG